MAFNEIAAPTGAPTPLVLAVRRPPLLPSLPPALRIVGPGWSVDPRRLAAGVASASCGLLVLIGLSAGLIAAPDAFSQSAAMDVLMLRPPPPPPPVRQPPGPPLAQAADAGGAALASQQPPRPETVPFIPPPPTAVLRWQRVAMAPAATAASAATVSSDNGNSRTGLGGGGIYDPYAGAAPMRRELTDSVPPQGATTPMSRQTLATALRLQLGSGVTGMRCLINSRNGRVMTARCNGVADAALSVEVEQRLAGSRLADQSTRFILSL